jgi:hypothetical protein
MLSVPPVPIALAALLLPDRQQITAAMKPITRRFELRPGRVDITAALIYDRPRTRCKGGRLIGHPHQVTMQMAGEQRPPAIDPRPQR